MPLTKHQTEDDHAIFELADAPHRPTGKQVKVTTPSQIYRCDSKEDLDAALSHFNQPFISLAVPDSTFAHRQFVEKVRPALRYYCVKFGQEIPAWLKDDKQFTEKPDAEKLKLFGTVTLRIREFTKIRTPEGASRG